MLPAELLRALDTLDADELALAVRMHVQGKGLSDAALALGWTWLRVERTRKRLSRKLGRLADQMPSSGRVLADDLPTHSIPHYRETLSTGRRVWAMGSVPDSFRALVIESLNIQVIENNQNVRNAPRSGALKLKFDLQTQLVDAQKNLERLLDESETAARAVRVVEAEVVDFEAKMSSVEDVLAGSKPKPNTLELEQVRAKAAQAREVVRIYSLAIDEARRRVESARSDIEAHQMEIDRGCFVAEVKQWDAAVATMLKAHQAIHEKLMLLDRGVYLSEIFFPVANISTIDWRASNERAALMQIFNSVAQLRKMRATGEAKLYDRAKEVAA